MPLFEPKPYYIVTTHTQLWFCLYDRAIFPTRPIDKMKAPIWRCHYGPLTTSVRPFGIVKGA